MSRFAIALLVSASVVAAQGQTRPTSPYTLDEMRGKQAVVETSMGTIVVDLLPEKAPNTVGLFMKRANDGVYDGTTFHRVVRYGIIQGGDPLSKDPASAADVGSGGAEGIAFESNDESHTAGAVAAALLGDDRNSGGAQFFIDVTDQTALDGAYPIFGRVVDGIEVAQQISAVDADAEGRPATPVVIRSVRIRDTPPVPFANDTPADLARYTAVLETSMGEIALEMRPDLAPETVRQFLRLADAGVYDGTAVHRVAPNFVVQTGALAYRSAPLTASQQRLVHDLAAEFSDEPNEPGTVSMARGEDPNSASTSFFICIGSCRALDGKYTIFAKVSGGQDVLDAIATVPVDGETPRTTIVVKHIQVRSTK